MMGSVKTISVGRSGNWPSSARRNPSVAAVTDIVNAAACQSLSGRRANARTEKGINRINIQISTQGPKVKHTLTPSPVLAFLDDPERAFSSPFDQLGSYPA